MPIMHRLAHLPPVTGTCQLRSPMQQKVLYTTTYSMMQKVLMQKVLYTTTYSVMQKVLMQKALYTK